MTGQHKVVTIIGAGRLARAVALVLDAGGHEVRIYARHSTQREALQSALSHAVACPNLAEACRNVDFLFFAVPTTALPEVCRHYAPHARGDQVIVHACRGVLPGFVLPHMCIRNQTAVRRVGVLGGPLYFEEAEQGHPLTAVVASRYDDVTGLVRSVTSGTIVHTYPSRDVVGVEVAGAISNVGLLAAGMAEALHLGDTARGLLLTQCLTEAARLGVTLGAQPETFTGLAGVGDLIPRRVSSRRHHVEAGQFLAGAEVDVDGRHRLASIEGAVTALAADDFARKRGLELPLVAAVTSVIVGKRSAGEALEDVLRRDLLLGITPGKGNRS